jgi:sec-independent protein translocase protein TatA
MGSIGLPEMVFIFVLALLIFGPKKLPELGRSLGKGISEFRRASAELKNSFEREMQNLEQETKVDDSPTRSASETGSTAASTSYDYTAPEPNDSYSHDENYSYEGYKDERQS